jgi:CheY-like chemotaxis protein
MTPTNKDTVLVLEDEEEARLLLVQVLEHEGFKALGFSNGAEALAYLSNAQEPCLIVLDLLMPVMDGPRFRAAMLREPRFAKIPVVVVTALDASRAAGMGALRVFRKPVDVNSLLDVVRQNC